MRLKTIVSYVLSFCLFLVHSSQGLVNMEPVSQESVRVAYVGFYFEEVEAEQQNEIEDDIFVLLDSEPRLFAIPRQSIRDQLGEELWQKLKADPQEEDLQTAAGLLDANHIFAGSLENPSSDPEYTALVGEVIRYDTASNQMYNLRIQSFYEDFDSELSRIYTQLIQTIIPAEEKSFFRRYLPGILIVAATAIAVTVLLSGTDGQGNREGPGPITP